MTTHAYLALVACPHGSGGVFFGISGGLRGRGGSLLPKGHKSRAAARRGAKIFDTPTRFSRTVFVGNANPPSSDTLGVRGSRFPHSLTKLEIGVMLEQKGTFLFTMVEVFTMKIRC